MSVPHCPHCTTRNQHCNSEAQTKRITRNVRDKDKFNVLLYGAFAMKKTALALTLIFALLFSAVGSVQLATVATADPLVFLPYITIKSDRSVEPQTSFIKQDGNVYTLTKDLVRNYAININCSNIVFDAEGHFIDGAGYANVGLALNNVSNVIVKNVTVFGFAGTNIAFMECSQCSLLKANTEFLFAEGGMNNEIADNIIGELDLEATEKNTIIRNNITDILIVLNSNDNLLNRNSIYSIFFRDNNDGNVFLLNNFWCGKVGPSANFFEFVGKNFWDNGSVGNYWSNYNGSDLNMDGIGDAPYFIDNKAVEIVIAQDNYPLMSPYDIEHDTIVLPPTELFVAIIVVAVVVLVGAGLSVYFRKRKH
jgi:hypothetical protein